MSTGTNLEECPDLEGIETSSLHPIALTCGTHDLEECPDLEGIETKVYYGCFSVLIISLEECPDLEGIETTEITTNTIKLTTIWSSAPT